MQQEQRICTLTGACDRKEGDVTDIKANEPSLSNEELKKAMKELSIDSFPKKVKESEFRQIERRHMDPPLELQKIGLFSFIPAKGVQPNDKGIFGYIKLRGNYVDASQARDRARLLIETVDSYHKVFHALVGYPYPLTESSQYSQDTDVVEIKKDVAFNISEDVKKKRQEEEKEIQEIQDREKNLLEDVKQPQEDNKEDYYTTLKTKKAQLIWTFVENKKKLSQILTLIAKAKREVEQLDEKDPTLNSKYLERYLNARKQAGLKTSEAELTESFMKYLVDDIPIPEVDMEYKKLYGVQEEKED